MKTIFVPGIPVTQGSMKYVGRGRVVHDKGEALMGWRDAVGTMARLEMDGAEPHDGAVAICIRVYLPRPKRNHDKQPIRRNDIDKEARAILDGLCQIVFRDDGRVTNLTIAKQWATADVPCGARISWEALG